MSAIGRHVSKLSGYAPALPTPFNDQDDIDVDAFAHLCDLQIANGATALVVCGTTGEAPTLSRPERGELIRIAVGASRGRVPVIAGAGSNATTQAIELSKVAEANGADAILSVVPTTISRHKKAFTPTIARSPPRRDCRSSSMMFRRERDAALPTKPWRGWPRSGKSSASKMPLAT